MARITPPETPKIHENELDQKASVHERCGKVTTASGVSVQFTPDRYKSAAALYLKTQALLMD